jgi:hypothetical protein
MNKEYRVVWHIEKKVCKCDNWLNHWMRAAKKRAFPECSVASCTQSARTGGHIVACDDPHGEVFVIPLCREHDSSLFTDCFRINQRVKLIAITNHNFCKP